MPGLASVGRSFSQRLASQKGLLGTSAALGVGAAFATNNVSERAFDAIAEPLLGVPQPDRLMLGGDVGIGSLIGLPGASTRAIYNRDVLFSPQIIGGAFGRNKTAVEVSMRNAASSLERGYGRYPYRGSSQAWQPRTVTQRNASAVGAQIGASGDMVFGMYNLRMG